MIRHLRTAQSPMLKAISLAVALLIMQTVQAIEPQDPADIEAMKKGKPKDVASFISRSFGCWHFGGEEAYDAERAKELQAAVEQLKCNRLAEDEAKLRHKYRNNPDILKAIDNAKSF